MAGELNEEAKTRFFAYINKQDNKGKTAIYMAVENNRSESTKTLLSFNADVNIADNEGKSPLDVALAGGLQDTINVLLEDDVPLKLDFVSHLPESERETFTPKIFSSLFEMKQADVSTKASILGRLLKKGAVIYPTALDNLLAKQGDQRAAYNAAVEEALKSRARQLSLKLKDSKPPLPVSVETVEDTAHCPMDEISKLTGFTIPV